MTRIAGIFMAFIIVTMMSGSADAQLSNETQNAGKKLAMSIPAGWDIVEVTDNDVRLRKLIPDGACDGIYMSNGQMAIYELHIGAIDVPDGVFIWIQAFAVENTLGGMAEAMPNVNPMSVLASTGPYTWNQFSNWCGSVPTVRGNHAGSR